MPAVTGEHDRHQHGERDGRHRTDAPSCRRRQRACQGRPATPQVRRSHQQVGQNLASPSTGFRL